MPAFDITEHLSTLLIAIGLAVIVVGVVMIAQHRHRLREWTRVQGEVTGYSWGAKTSSDSSAMQHWIYRWTGTDGVERQRRSTIGTSWGTLRSFPFPVDVLINPNDAEHGIPATGRTGAMVGLMLVVVGVSLSVGTLLVTGVLL